MPRMLVATLLIAALVAALLAPAPARTLAQNPTDEQLDRIQERVIRLRELEARGPINRVFMKREDLRAHYQEKFFEDNPAEELETTQHLLELLGYIQPGTDIMGLWLDVLGEEVLGFYERDTKTVHVVSDQARFGPTDIATLAHEITHALQDQHWDLKAAYEARRDHNDRTLAFQALVEGDATLLHSLYSLRYLPTAGLGADGSSSSGSALQSAPLILQRELLFPYEEGVNFLLGHFLEGFWPAVNAVWRDPPESTEQILHPEKYRARELPMAIQMPDLAALLGSDWRLLDEDTLGELDWQILIEQYVDLPTAKQAAAGWGGDRFQLLRRETDGALLFGTRTGWDTEPDAVEFFEAYQRVAAGRHGAALQVMAEPDLFEFPDLEPAPHAAWAASAGNLSHALVRDGAMVTLAIWTHELRPGLIVSLRFPDGPQ